MGEGSDCRGIRIDAQSESAAQGRDAPKVRSVSRKKTIRLVVSVKAYPTPSVKYHEAVCVAGIRIDTPNPEWVRLYPVNFRDLTKQQQFQKYDEIEVTGSTHSSDTRPESFRPDVSSIRVVRRIGTRDGWSERRSFVEPLLEDSMCSVLKLQEEHGTSLGAFRPNQVLDVLVQQEPAEWSPEDRDKLSQLTLWTPNKRILEKIPWRWRLKYSCGKGCNTHTQTIIDWEIAQAWRRWRRDYPPAKVPDRIRDHWLNDLCSESKDTIFFVGNQHQHLRSFLVLGVFWPPKIESPDVDHPQLGI
jgi:hypothetical protein